jgi:hypothetical protein
LEKLNRFIVENCIAKPELYIGKVEREERKGGRIDIILRDNIGHSIIFENKIEAGDQDNQLVRYNNYDRFAPIFYLTLFGEEPSEKSKGNLIEGEDYVCISYKNDILVWLHQCKEKAVNIPILRESITQYIYLIKHLTNQTMNVDMKNEIISQILSTSQNIESAEIIVENWDQVRLEILSNLKEELIKKDGIADILNLKVEFDKPLGLKDSGFWFYKNHWTHCIYFVFDRPFRNLLLGIQTIKANGEIDLDLKKQVQSKLSNTYFGKNLNYPNWLWVCEFEKWDEIAWKDVVNEFPNLIFQSVKTVVSEIDGLQL